MLFRRDFIICWLQLTFKLRQQRKKVFRKARVMIDRRILISFIKMEEIQEKTASLGTLQVRICSPVV